MVRIDKSKVRVPAILGIEEKGGVATQELIKRYNAGERDFKTTDFTSKIYGHTTVKSLLIEIQHGKCCFCEQKRPHGREGDVEHFRPKTGFQINARSPLIKPGYYWLAYNFDNLFYACKVCNQEYKKNLFPLTNEKKRAFCHEDDWRFEDSLILHPEYDEPAEHIEFIAEFAKPKNNSLKGKATIELVGLNDPKLVEQRSKYLYILRKLASVAGLEDEEIQKLFKDAGTSDSQFSLMVRCNFPDLV